PTASFTFSPTNPLVNQTVQFNGGAPTAATGRTIVTYKWDFGDGSADGSGVTPQHSYTVDRVYTVVLTVTDDVGHTGVTSQTVTVSQPPPTASFTISPTDPAVNQTVQFNGQGSTAAAGRTITTYEWD